MIFNLFLLSFQQFIFFCDFMQPYFHFVLTTESCIEFCQKSAVYIVLNITDFAGM